MLIDVSFGCLHSRLSTDPNDAYARCMAFPGLVLKMQHLQYRLLPLPANILACGEWVTGAEEFLGLVWLKVNDVRVFDYLIPDGLITLEIPDGPRFSDRPCVYLRCT